MRTSKHYLTQFGLAGMLLVLAGCATTGTHQEPQIQRISQEELDRIMPKPVPNISLEQLVALSKTTPPEVLIEQIKTSNSRYDLTPSQVLDLGKKGVSPKVMDYIQAAHDAAVRDSFADEINKREKQKQLDQERLRREYLWRSQPYYDPWWGYSAGPYWRGPGFGSGFYYRRGW